MEEKYGVPVLPLDCAKASQAQLTELMSRLLGRFPMKEIRFSLPGYVEGLDADHWLKKQLIEEGDTVDVETPVAILETE